MITKPPPNDSAPTLSAVHASEPSRRSRSAGSEQDERRQRRPCARAGAALEHELATPAARAARARGRPEQRRRDGADGERTSAASVRPVVPDARDARADQPPSGMHGDGGDRGTGPCAAPRIQSGGGCARNSSDSARISTTAGTMNPSPPTTPRRARDAIGAEDRELRRRRAGQQAACGVRVLELGRVEPAACARRQRAQQRDVRRRAAEAGHPDPCPLASDDRERDVRSLGRRLRWPAHRMTWIATAATYTRKPRATGPCSQSRRARSARARSTCAIAGCRPEGARAWRSSLTLRGNQAEAATGCVREQHVAEEVGQRRALGRRERLEHRRNVRLELRGHFPHE